MQNPIWKFESDLTYRVPAWSILALLSRLYSWFAMNKLRRGCGIQLATSGAGDTVIVLVSGRSAARRKSPADPKKEAFFIHVIKTVVEAN